MVYVPEREVDPGFDGLAGRPLPEPTADPSHTARVRGKERESKRERDKERRKRLRELE